MAAPKGNTYWTLRQKPCSFKAYEPNELWKKACEYFEWIDQNPNKSEETTIDNGRTKTKTIIHRRPFTESGLCVYLGIARTTFDNYKKGHQPYNDHLAVSQAICEIIRSQKFEGAASGIFNANIIARDLGLVDKVQSEVKGNINVPLEAWKQRFTKK